MTTSTRPERALRRWFPDVPGFRDKQPEALARLWEGRSSLVLMPTGTGKSLVYQLPVFASGGVGVVVSPLVALMRQQADRLQQLGAEVLQLGGSDAREAQEALKRFPWAKSGPAFLFVSPERAETDGYIEFLLRKHRDRVRLVAIDEAHCISQWGHDFRPPYKSLPGFLDRTFGRGTWPPVVCLTATLDQKDQAEITSDFRLGEDDVVRSDNMLRTNLDLQLRVFDDGEAKAEALAELLDEHRGQKVIVYAHRKHSKKHGTRALAARFAGLGHACAAFDADLPMAEKRETLERFESGDLHVVFATGAFGMGVDIPDIRGVVHYLIPESIEQYYQEVGRAGRDGDNAFGVLLHNPTNTKVRRDMIGSARRTRDQVREVWNELFGGRHGATRTVDPWSEFQGKDDEHALFYAFQRCGALEVIARGPGRLRSFQDAGPLGAELLGTLHAATRTGNVGRAAAKLGRDPAEVVDELYRLYDDDELKLVLSPGKTLYYRTRELTDEDVDGIVSDLDAKVEKRLAAFEELVAIVESGADPGKVLAARFG